MSADTQTRRSSKHSSQRTPKSTPTRHPESTVYLHPVSSSWLPFQRGPILLAHLLRRPMPLLSPLPGYTKAPRVPPRTKASPIVLLSPAGSLVFEVTHPQPAEHRLVCALLRKALTKEPPVALLRHPEAVTRSCHEEGLTIKAQVLM